MLCQKGNRITERIWSVFPRFYKRECVCRVYEYKPVMYYDMYTELVFVHKRRNEGKANVGNDIFLDVRNVLRSTEWPEISWDRR